MRLEPVLLVAQDPPPTPPATRRAFVFGAAVFATGLSLGGACGYAIGARRADEDPAAAPVGGQEELKPSGDADLDELRRLAVKAPIEELVKHRVTLLRYVGQTYRKDRWLWSGVRRLVDYVISTPSYPERKIASIGLVQVIQLGSPEIVGELLDKVPELKRIK